ncbi:transposase [Streptomyces sp. NPDC047014]|uniref:IS701 family transposase n=1 Tax=Streptomyces sp. NPDC047014 TaxID=3155736 RepID=UPI0033D85B80
MTAHTRTRALAAGDTALDEYTERLFGHLPRADQRRWARVYLQGLLTTPGKKSVRRLAASVTESPTASQSLQQFINASPWEWDPARTELQRWVEERHAVRAWTIGQVCFPKRGEHSVGVHRRFDPAAGRMVNCQFGFGLFLSLDGMSLPVDWRLVLPESWSADPALRRRARISADAVHQSPESLVLDLLDATAARTTAVRPPVVADLSRLTGAAALIGTLARRGHDFLVSVPPALPVCAAGPEPTRHGTTAADLTRRTTTTHPHSPRIPIHSTLVRVPGDGGKGTGGLRGYRLFGEGRPDGRLWLTNMSRHRMDDLLHLTRQSTRAGATLATLAEDFGLLDFEGRSFPGWHHHMTLMSTAYAYTHRPLPAIPHQRRH